MAIGFAVGLILGGASVASFAAASDYGRSMRLNAPSSSGARFTGAPIYDWADAPSGWGRMNDINKINIGSKSFDVTGGRLFSPQTLAKGAVSFVRYGGVAWLGFMLAPLIWDEVEGWLYEPEGVQPEDGNETWKWASAHYPGQYDGWFAACERNADYYELNQPQYGPITITGYTVVNATTLACRGTVPQLQGTWGYGNVTKVPECATGFYSDGGQCLAESQPRPATDQELEDAIYVELVARGMGSDLARRLIEAGYKPTPDGFDLDGPSSIPGDTVTTTTSGPAGQTSTTTNTTHNMTYNTTNNTSTVTITNTTTTTVTSPDGTTTETTTETPPAGGETTPPEEPKPFCELYPTASACAELGETQDEELDEESVNVSWQQEGGAAGVCPAPIQISVLGTQHAIQWTPICQVASGIRPIVIGLAWLSAALWLFLMARARA